MKSSKNDKKDEPSPEPKPDPNKKEEKGGFGTWYKNNLLIAIPLTVLFNVIVGYILVAFIFAICDVVRRSNFKFYHYSPF